MVENFVSFLPRRSRRSFHESEDEHLVAAMLNPEPQETAPLSHCSRGGSVAQPGRWMCSSQRARISRTHRTRWKLVTLSESRIRNQPVFEKISFCASAAIHGPRCRRPDASGK